MTASTPENAETWHGLRDQLTTDQIAELERKQRDPDLLVRVTGDPQFRFDSDTLRCYARAHARNNLGALMIGEVPAPAGAVQVSEWFDADTPDAFRTVDLLSLTVATPDEEFTVAGRAHQYSDGRLEYEMPLCPCSEAWTTAQARELAAALVAVADEIDNLRSA